MEKLIILMIALATLYLFYKGITLLYFYYFLRIKLRAASFETFKKVLGNSYFHREIYDGYIRYKWYKGWIIVRASFDREGRLLKSERPEHDISKPISEFTFSK